MATQSRYVIVAGAFTFALLTATGQPARADIVTVPPTPPEVQVPPGNKVFLKGSAEGTQNYICLPSGSGFAFRFVAPQATLFLTFNQFGRDFRQQIITHFLSPNPAEKDTARATWQGSLDTSKVWAKINASSSDPKFVEAGAIPWLLLERVGSERGPTGGDLLTDTTFIQRLTTSGGIAPSTGCSQSSDVGAVALVPYTSDYFFYKRDR